MNIEGPETMSSSTGGDTRDYTSYDGLREWLTRELATLEAGEKRYLAEADKYALSMTELELEHAFIQATHEHIKRQLNEHLARGTFDADERRTLEQLLADEEVRIKLDLIFGSAALASREDVRTQTMECGDKNALNLYRTQYQGDLIHFLVDHQHDFEHISTIVRSVGASWFGNDAAGREKINVLMQSALGPAEVALWYGERNHRAFVAPPQLDAIEKTDLVVVEADALMPEEEERLVDALRDVALKNHLELEERLGAELYRKITRVQVKSKASFNKSYNGIEAALLPHAKRRPGTAPSCTYRHVLLSVGVPSSHISLFDDLAHMRMRHEDAHFGNRERRVAEVVLEGDTSWNHTLSGTQLSISPSLVNMNASKEIIKARKEVVEDRNEAAAFFNYWARGTSSGQNKGVMVFVEVGRSWNE